MILARNSITVSHVRDIISTTWYYKLQASTAAKPAKPTTATPSGWTTTEPSYTEGSTNSLYTTEKTTFSDGTFEYSDVSLSSSYEAAKLAYNKSVQAQNIADAALAQSIEYIVGTQTAATGSWKGTTTDTELASGKTIAYKLPYAGSGNASLTLTLADGTETAAVPVYLNTTRVTTHFGAGSVINMTYDGTAWRASSIPNSNNYDRRMHSSAIKADTAITKNHIIAGSAEGYSNLASGLIFDLAYPILYASAAIAANKTATSTYEAMPSITFSTSGTIEEGAAAKMLFLKGTVSGNTFTVAASPFFTTVVPTEEDGYCYIPIGIMTSATVGYFATSDKLHCFKDGAFGPVSTREASAAASLAQKKAEVFYSAPSLPYEAGDMWVRTFAEESGDVRKAIYVCIDSREASGDPEADAWHDEWETDWGLASTDDAAAEELLAQVDAVSEDLAQTKLDLADQIAENTDAIAAAQSGLASAIAASAENTERLAELGQYFSIIDQILELRASGSPLALKLTNSALAFLYNGEAQADINAEGFNFDKGVVRKQLRIGNFLLTSSASGRFDVQYSAED